MSGLFNSVELAPPVEVFALVAAFNDDNHEQKVNLGIGGSKVSACICGKKSRMPSGKGHAHCWVLN